MPIRFEPNPSPIWTVDPSIFPGSKSFDGSFRVNWEDEYSQSLNKPDTLSSSGQLPSTEDNTPLQEEHAKPDTFEEDLFRSPAGKILYAEPRLMKKPQGHSMSEEDIRAFRIDIKDFILDKKSYIVEVRPECGGTSLCKRLELEISKLENHACLRKEAQDLPNYRKKLTPVFVGVDHNKTNVLVLDNFTEDKDERLVKEIMSLGIFSRVIVVTTNRAPTVFEAPEHAELYQQLERIYLWPLNREDVRSVTHALFDTNDENLVSQIVDKIYQDLLALCIPLTPTNVIMYLRILHREGQYQPINRVDLIGRYLQEMLQSPAEIYSDTFNVKNKLDILSSFVYNLYTESRYAFDDSYWYSFLSDYQKKCLFEFDGQGFLKELTDLRLFGRWRGGIYIKYSFFFNFLLGRHLLAKPRLLESFMKGEEYLRMVGVVEVISGLSSDNGELLTSLTDRLETCVKEFSDKYIGSDIDPFRGALWSESEDEESALWRPVNEKVASGPKNASEIDKIKSSLLAEARTQYQLIDFEKFSEMEYKVFSIERLVKDVLRNSDDVIGATKVRAFRAIQDSNLVSFQVGSYFAPLICKKPLFRWFGVTFIDFDQAGEPGASPTSEEKIFDTVYAVCSSISSQSAQEVAAAKLTPVFRSVINNWRGEVRFQELVAFNALLYARGPHWGNDLEVFLNKVDRRSYYLLFCLNRMVNVLRNEIMPTRDRIVIKRLIVLIQTKRAFKTQNPGEKAMRNVEAQLRKGNYPPLVEDGKYEDGQ